MQFIQFPLGHHHSLTVPKYQWGMIIVAVLVFHKVRLLRFVEGIVVLVQAALFWCPDLAFLWGLRIRNEHDVYFGLIAGFCRYFGMYAGCLELIDWILASLVLYLSQLILLYFLRVVGVIVLVVLRSSLVVLLVPLIIIHLFLVNYLIFVQDLR